MMGPHLPNMRNGQNASAGASTSNRRGTETSENDRTSQPNPSLMSKLKGYISLYHTPKQLMDKDSFWEGCIYTTEEIEKIGSVTVIVFKIHNSHRDVKQFMGNQIY